MDTYLQRLREAIISATVDMNAEDLTRHPEGKWSTAQVLEHLYLSYSGTVKGFERCLQAGKPLARAPVLKDRMRAFVVTGLGHFPTGRQAPERHPGRAVWRWTKSRAESAPQIRRHGRGNRAMRSSLWQAELDYLIILSSDR